MIYNDGSNTDCTMDIQKLKQLVRYDPETGKVFSAVDRWRLKAGDELCKGQNSGYKHFEMQGIRYAVHRVAFAITYGYIPDNIDHINGITTDNRIANLRPATPAENNRNTNQKWFSTSRFRGISKNGNNGRWRALIRKDGDLINLGSYGRDVEAAYAYDVASIELHGDFGRRNFLPLVRQ